MQKGDAVTVAVGSQLYSTLGRDKLLDGKTVCLDGRSGKVQWFDGIRRVASVEFDDSWIGKSVVPTDVLELAAPSKSNDPIMSDEGLMAFVLSLLKTHGRMLNTDLYAWIVPEMVRTGNRIDAVRYTRCYDELVSSGAMCLEESEPGKTWVSLPTVPGTKGVVHKVCSDLEVRTCIISMISWEGKIDHSTLFSRLDLAFARLGWHWPTDQWSQCLRQLQEEGILVSDNDMYSLSQRKTQS